MSEAQKAAWCREKGLFPSELEGLALCGDAGAGAAGGALGAQA